ncbi:MAG: hypothetical protein ACHP8B_10920 [Terriglobales bacterium]
MSKMVAPPPRPLPPPPPGTRNPDPDVREAHLALENAWQEMARGWSRRPGIRAQIKKHPACKHLNALLRLEAAHPELTYEGRRVYFAQMEEMGAARVARRKAAEAARNEAKAAGKSKREVIEAGRRAADAAAPYRPELRMVRLMVEHALAAARTASASEE